MPLVQEGIGPTTFCMLVLSCTILLAPTITYILLQQMIGNLGHDSAL